MVTRTNSTEDRSRNGHVLVWEQAEIRPEYEQAAHKLGKRHFVTFMLFLGMANAYVMRTNMSVAIVAMVNHTALDSEVEIELDDCPDTDYGNVTEKVQDGEFVWSTTLQAYVLSSFFYGYVLTQQSPPIPYKSIALSLPFYAILFAHMGQNYGYETLMTELPTYMKQVLRFSLKAV
uniref:CSON013570 protein n=1 Tax=Culicoides sonorensis TaxID=179676 RepID=A0A336KZ27_CULSO